jgi:hypothetical protein
VTSLYSRIGSKLSTHASITVLLVWLIFFSIDVSAQSLSSAGGNDRPSSNPFEVGSSVGGGARANLWPTTGKEFDILEAKYEENPLYLRHLYLFYSSIGPVFRPKPIVLYASALLLGTSFPTLVVLTDSSLYGFKSLVVAAMSLVGVRTALRLRKESETAGALTEAFVRFDLHHDDEATRYVEPSVRKNALQRASKINSNCVTAYRILTTGGAIMVGSGVLMVEETARSIPAYQKARAKFLKSLSEKVGWP